MRKKTLDMKNIKSMHYLNCYFKITNLIKACKEYTFVMAYLRLSRFLPFVAHTKITHKNIALKTVFK